MSVLFADIVNYTQMSKEVDPEEVMELLHCLFSKYDALTVKHNVYKVETIGARARRLGARAAAVLPARRPPAAAAI